MAKVGGQPGDVIMKINGVSTQQIDDLRMALARGWGRGSILAVIQRGRGIFYVPIPL